MTLQVVVGGQYGSEGKGAVAAWLCGERQNEPLLAVRVGGPNAGHTVIGRCPPGCANSGEMLTGREHVWDQKRTAQWGQDAHSPDNHPWRLRQVPVAAVSNPRASLMIAAGSEIDPAVLHSEIAQLDAAGYKASARLFISGQATVIEPGHQAAERVMAGNGSSTGKGIGAARAGRAMRTARLARQLPDIGRGLTSHEHQLIMSHLERGRVLVEGTQGYGLGSHAGYYPDCTSGDCTAVDMLAMAGISPWVVSRDELEIWVVYRAYPIRIAGNSGPMRHETTWEALGLPQELTTVTRKVRRVGEWDDILARRSAMANGAGSKCVRAALTMADHWIPGLAGVSGAAGLARADWNEELSRRIQHVEEATGLRVELVGTGPDSMIDLRDWTAQERNRAESLR